MQCKQIPCTPAGKKGNEPPKGRTCPFHNASECSPLLAMHVTRSAVAAAPPGVHRMRSLHPTLPRIGQSTTHCASSTLWGFIAFFCCQHCMWQGENLYATCHMHCLQRRAKKGNEPPRGVELVPHGALSARLKLDPLGVHPFACNACGR